MRKHHFVIDVLRGYVWDTVHEYTSTDSGGAWVNLHMYKKCGIVRITMDGALYYSTKGE